MPKQENIVGVKFKRELLSEEDLKGTNLSTSDTIIFKKPREENSLPIYSAQFENLGKGKKLTDEDLLNKETLETFKNSCEHIQVINLEEGIMLADQAIYKDTMKCIANYIIANPILENELKDISKKVLYSPFIKTNELLFIYKDKLMFPAHIESNIKMDNPSLVKVIEIL